VGGAKWDKTGLLADDVALRCYMPVILLMLALLAGMNSAGKAEATAADLELVLAVDASGSVDEAEFTLQLEGIAAGFRDAKVRQAIRSGVHGRIAVNLIVWAEHQMPKDSSGWFLLSDDGGAEVFARLVEAFPRRQNGATGIGEGVAAAVRAIESNAIEGLRKTIDVSGDGRETAPRDFVVLVPQARTMAHSRRITINGLAILNEDPSLLDYYRAAVQSGPDSFVMAVEDYTAMASAMRRKLLREIEYRPKLSRR
jgi:hypothetical protein